MKMKKEEKKTKKTALDSSMPEDANMHDNGYWYREFEVPGIDEPVKLFNCLKPARLEEETFAEYKIRRKFMNHKNHSKMMFHNSAVEGTYINNNKRKFKK